MVQDNNGQELSDEVNIKEVLQPYLRRWRWFIISVLIFGALAVFYLQTTTPTYAMRSTVVIRDVKKSPLDFGALSDLSSFGGRAPSSVNNEIEIFKSKKLMNEVVNRLNLQITTISKKNFTEEELYQESAPFLVKVIGEKYYKKRKAAPIRVIIEGDRLTLQSEDLVKPIVTTYGKTISLPYANVMMIKNASFDKNKYNDLGDLFFQYNFLDKTITKLQKKLDVSLVDKDATVIGLTIKQENIDKGKAIVNTLVSSFNADAIDEKNSESQKTKEFIDERVALIAKELGDVENEKEQFKTANKITDLAEEAKLNLSTSVEVRARLLDAETQLMLTNDIIGYLNTQNNTQTLPASVGLSNPTASANITSYNALVLERNRLLENATPQNPVVQELAKQIDVLKSSVRQNLVSSKNSLAAIVQQMQNEQNMLSGKITKVPAQEKLFRTIERQQAIKENLYLVLLQKREETAIMLANTTPKAKIVDDAYPSEKPISPKKMLTLLLAIVAGLALPVVYIYLKGLLNNRIHSKHDLERLSNVKIIGEIPRLRAADTHTVQKNDLSPLAEAFRILITNINFMIPGKRKGKTIFVTSSIKGEGKTFTSLNLALTLATPAAQVIIIGADIRNPQLQRYDRDKKGAEGLTEYLYDETKHAEDIIFKSTFNENCDIIYSGSIPPNPTELLSNGRISELLSELKNLYDYIIVDTAPLMLVTDSLLFAKLADVTVYVTRSGYTEKRVIAFANSLASEDKIRNAAFVINDVPKEHYGYGNKYGYGYTADERNWNWFEKVKDRF